MTWGSCKHADSDSAGLRTGSAFLTSSLVIPGCSSTPYILNNVRFEVSKGLEKPRIAGKGACLLIYLEAMVTGLEKYFKGRINVPVFSVSFLPMR